MRLLTMSRNSRKRQRKTLKKIREREEDRLGSSNVVYTRSFSGRQKFGSASAVRRINPEELSPEEIQRLVSRQ